MLVDTARKTDGIFRDEPAKCRVVVSGPVKINASLWIELAPGVLEPIGDRSG
jgi:hypothetical protein